MNAIYIQAKRWNNLVGRPDVQAFAVSLEGQMAKKGVFITTSRFSSDAKDYVKMIDKKIALIDGELLTRLISRTQGSNKEKITYKHICQVIFYFGLKLESILFKSFLSQLKNYYIKYGIIFRIYSIFKILTLFEKVIG
jgi:hypothetical protein